ncbi:MAG TPA: D-2-hydroxyacid dehydrogenase [Steroidobacteraceae bacterium]|nr:D-2-hydroxyacid dehydrogenase [Steroidobacteraceae bacterium]
MQAVFLDYDTVSSGDLDTSAITQAAGAVRFCAATTDGQIGERIGDAGIVLLNKLRLSRAHLQAARELKLIALAATGTDNIDLVAAQERGIAVCNIRGYCTRSVVQHAWAMILSLTQHLSEYARLVTDGSWARSEEFTVLAHPIRELSGRTLGVVGWGELGQGVAKAAEAFGMRVSVANRPGAAARPGRVELAQLLAMADVVSLHCPLTPATHGLIGARELERMKPDALLINTARGALVDSYALAEALKERRLGGAGIDVLPQEPPIDGDPLLDPGVPNLIVTPHIAWAAREARQRCLDEMAANVRDFLCGGRRGRVV